MTKDWNDVDFKFGQAVGGLYDAVVTDYGSRMTLTERLANRKLAKEALNDALKELKKDDPEGESRDPHRLTIHYEGKGHLTALLLHGEPNAFVLQTHLRKAFAGMLKTDGKDKVVQLSLNGLNESAAQQVLNAFAALAVLVRFKPETFGKKQKDQKKQGKLTVYVQTTLKQKLAEHAIEEGRILAVCNNQVRFLADLPGNVLNPKSYREKVEMLAKELKVDYEFLDRKDLKKRDAGAFLAVIKADLNHEAGIVHLKSPGSKKAKGGKGAVKKVALVGKGLCFDTGGYNVKTGESMLNMHRDMTGSAVALSLFRALVELETEYEVHAYLALAENLISHEGYRPNDVVIASNGMSIEVVDTDAEGRMVLSDTLALASEEKPDLIIDFATLTGSVVRALDTRRCGAYANRMDISRLAVEVGDRCGERLWNFPIGEDYFDSLKSEIADIRQCASSSCSDHIYAATFLSKFVGKGIPWIHIDLAADTNKGGLGLVPTETTGFGVRWGYAFIREFLG